MMKQRKRWYPILLVMLLTALLVSGCGASLKKPTGLEPLESEQEENQDEEKAEQEDEYEKQDKSKEKDVDLKSSEKEASAEEDVSSKGEVEKEEAKKEKKEAKKEASENPKEKRKEHLSRPSTQDEEPVATQPPASNPTEKPVEKPIEEEKKENTIVYSIVISSEEVPLSATEMEITEGDTVLQSLIDITKSKKIQMDYRGGQGATAYVEGIDNVYEFDRGQGSGWMFRVNGIFPDRGAGAIPLKPGDRVEWLYTTNLGEDLNADLQPFRR